MTSATLKDVEIIQVLFHWQWRQLRDYAAERVRHSTELADIVRIDHFRGFESYWSVPFGAKNARAGDGKDPQGATGDHRRPGGYRT